MLPNIRTPKKCKKCNFCSDNFPTNSLQTNKNKGVCPDYGLGLGWFHVTTIFPSYLIVVSESITALNKTANNVVATLVIRGKDDFDQFF